ncbi:MAG: AmmeMemoRadiSam system protein A [Chromatiales bacterium]|jgi:AmmeMemoRadiSam system protein A
MPSADDPAVLLGPEQRVTLLSVARESIAHGIERGRPLPVERAAFDPVLRERRASFVTLQQGGKLRGCIGHLEARQPLVADVAENAFSAAFRDPRFQPVGAAEVDALEVHISVLGSPVPLEFRSEDELVAQLRPGVDGLILEDGPYRGTFLPSVWESLPHPRVFLAHLKTKAGLPAGYWSDSLRVLRYRTESFS